MFAFGTPDARETVVQDPALEVFLHPLYNHRPQGAEFGFIPLFIFGLKRIEASVEGLPESG